MGRALDVTPISTCINAMKLNPLTRMLGAALLGACASFGALADDPVNGAVLYRNSCSGCHGGSPLTSNSSKIYFGRNARAVIENAIATDNSGMGSLRSAFPTNGSALADVAAYLGNAPSSLSFASTAVGSTAPAQTVTVSASLKSGFSIAGLTVATSGDFAPAGGTCGTAVATGTSCTVLVTFTPTAGGARTGTLSLTHNNTLTPIAIALSGTGAGTGLPTIALNASTLTFAAQALGSTSASQSVTVSNSGTAALTLSGLTLGGAAAGDFVQGGTCTASTSLAVGASCTVGFTFTPGATGARSATLTLASNASNGNAQLSLNGTGTAIAAPAASLSATALAFGNQTTGVASTARTATLTNTGSAALGITGITTAAPFAVSHNCPASLPAAASCTLSVTYTPTTNGAATGSVSVATNAAGSPNTIALSGSGVNSSPVLAWAPAAASLAFPDTTVGGSPAARSLILSNQGPGAVTLQQITLAGAQPAEFAINSGGAGACALNASIAQGASCTIALAFQPSAVGARSATLQVSSTGTNPPDVALAGNGTAPAQPAIGVVPGTLTFSVTAGASSGGTQTLTLQSTGTAVLHVNSVRVASGSFTLAAAATNGCAPAPFDLSPGQSCAVQVSWASTAPGTETGTVEINTTAAAAPTQVALQAVRASAAAPAPAAAGMSNLGAGGCSIARTDTLKDPTLWLLVLAATAVAWRRRAQR
jgi:hypothetical protein